VFRSPLWSEIMAAVLARPLQVVGEAEGTALGAAALGLFALQSASTLSEAVMLLADPRASEPPTVVADPELIATYQRVHAQIPQEIRELERVAGFYAGSTWSAP
jgi:gluconokinase